MPSSQSALCALAMVAAAGCAHTSDAATARAAGDGEKADQPAPAESAMTGHADHPSAAAEWSARTDNGRLVRIVPEQMPPRPGEQRFTITVDGEAAPLSLDLVSPSMPMHGVVRYPVVRSHRSWTATVEVAMAGDWIAYVNFDFGADAAAVPFTVPPDPVAVTHEHGRDSAADHAAHDHH